MQDNTKQIEYWNGEAGQKWAQNDTHFERSIGTLNAPLLERARAAGARRALDIGCGCGNQTLALAQALGPGAQVTGIDVSEPRLAVARTRAAAGAAQMQFLHADAATHAFEPQSFDLLFSRFGVMFFADPAAAFTNLRRACATGARLVFCCWQGVDRNGWLRLPMQALARHVELPPIEPHAPGPFAFGERERVQDILGQAGFTSIRCEDLRIDLNFAQGATLAEAAEALVQAGPAAPLLAKLDPGARADALAEVAAAVAPHYRNDCIMMPSAIWIVSASA